MRISDTLKKAAGLFIEFDPETTPQGPSISDEDFKKMMSSPAAVTPRTVAQVVRDTPGPSLEEIKVAPTPQVQPLRPDGTVDFSAIYAMANVADAAFTAEQLLDLLATLPAELPLEARRQTVKITIQAMSKTVPVTPQIIIADSSRKLAALAAYEDSYSKQANEFVAKSEADIADLESQIASKKAAIEEAKMKQDTMMKACKAQSEHLDDVLEFFSMDVPPSKYA